MEFNLKRTPVATLSYSLDTVSEQPVDIDFTLPDYCPDIEKLLRCKLTPKIYSRNLSGGQLQLDGNTVVSVLYMDSESRRVRAVEQTVPFSAVFRLKDTPENYALQTSVKCEYVNCRALSRRRLTVHGAFSVCAKAITKGETELYSPEGIENVEFLTRDVELTTLSALGSSQFSVGDEIIVSGKPPVELVLDSSVSARITETRVMPDRLSLSGELTVKLLYLSGTDSAKPERLDYIIPFAEALECEGLTDECVTCLNLDVMSYDIRLKNDILSENPLVNVDAKLSCFAAAYHPESFSIALDAFGTENVCEPEITRVTAPSDTNLVTDTFMLKDALQLDDSGISEIIDFTAEKCPLTVTASDGRLSLSSKLNICILALNSEGEPVYLERSVDVNRDLEADGNSFSCPEINIVSLSYRLADNNSVELRCELSCSIITSRSENLDIVCSVNCCDDKPIRKKSCALTLYFADKGERLWDIAKAYSTPKNLIEEENGTVADILAEPQMLLIPTV